LYKNVIYRCVVGSQAYGLERDSSDVDRRGIYLAPAELEWSLYGVPEQLENAETEECYWELKKFMVLALKANPNILECRYTPLVETRTPVAEELLAKRDIFLSKLVYQTYNGYVMSQFKKLEQDLRASGEIKWKHAMHLIRLLLEGITILKDGYVPVRVSEHRDALLSIRDGNMTWDEINTWRLSLHRKFEESFENTKLPDDPDYTEANRLLVTGAAIDDQRDRRLNEQLFRAVKEHPYALLFATVSGAHLYGFPSPDSDYDLRGVHILPAEEVMGLFPDRDTVEISKKEDIELDLVTHDVQKFFGLLLKANGYVLEQLYSPLVVHTTPEHEELKWIAESCITRHHAHHYFGFAENQWRLFQKEDPPRVKPLLYVFRVLLTGIHLMRTGIVEANLNQLNEEYKLAYIGELIGRKTRGTERQTLEQAEVSFYASEYDRLRKLLEDEAKRTKLPESQTARAASNDLLLRLRLRTVGIEREQTR